MSRHRTPIPLEAQFSEAVSALSRENWDFADADAADDIHSLHPYPAKFIPQLPERLINALSSPGDLILDPFSGGGTSGVEALRGGRHFTGIDANPIGVTLGKVKTTPLSAAARDSCLRLAQQVGDPQQKIVAASMTDLWQPEIPNQEKWYWPAVFDLLTQIRYQVMQLRSPAARRLALLIFANVAAKASHQDSETRYVSKPRPMDIQDVRRRFKRDMESAVSLIDNTNYPNGGKATFIEGDSRDAGHYPEDVGLAITSPPYPNAYDYHLYHRFRLFWLGPGPQALRDTEIGSHLKHQGEARPEESYLNDIESVLHNVHTALRDGRWFVLVVGDGIYKGALFHTSRQITDLADAAGFEVGAVVTRQLPQMRRSVTSAGRRLESEEIVFLWKPGQQSSTRPPNYELFPYERVLSQRESSVLAFRDSPAGTLLPRSQHLAKASFSHGFHHGDGVIPTFQFHLEGSPASTTRKKNSTYLTHGLHRYKGKFYPQLCKSLINICCLDEGDVVLDPFGGSGTTCLEANLLGLDGISFDTNPVAASIAQAKMDVLHAGESSTLKYLASLRRASEVRALQLSTSLDQFNPATLDELHRWFPIPVLRKLHHLLETAREGDRTLTALGLTLISDVVREVSQQDPKDLRIRRRQEPIEDAPVFELFQARLEKLEKNLLDYYTQVRVKLPRPGTSTVILGDCADSAAYPQKAIQAVITSPPYASALPYIDTDRLSLAVVHGLTAAERKPLETMMVGSREITIRERQAIDNTLVSDPASLELPQGTINFLQSLLEAVKNDPSAGFRRQQTPAVLTRYFRAMSLSIGNLAAKLERGRDLWMVVGDSRTTIDGTQWRIPTTDELCEIGISHGFTLVERMPITVTREDVLHSRNAIVHNEILHLRL